MNKKIIVIGGGPGGYAAAIRAAQLQAQVVLIEKDSIGGTCLIRGCIPTKTFYRSAEFFNNVKRASEFGIEVSEPFLNLNKLQERKNTVVNQLVSGVTQLMKANSIEVIKGTALIKGRNEVEVLFEDGSKSSLSCDNIIIATGSRSANPPIKGSDLQGVVYSDELMNFASVPESLVIIGGGVIGMEFGGIFNAFGSKVTIVEALPSILNMLDGEIIKRLNPMMKKQGIDILTSAMVKEIGKKDGRLQVKVEGKKGELTLEGEQVLIATGRKANVENLGLEEAGILYDKKGITVDENLETTLKGVYAIGDVNGRVMLAHAASHQGVTAAEIIMGQNTEKEGPIPNCIFIFPEIASLGLREDELKAKGEEYKVSKFLFGANGKALALGEGEGFIKVICDKDNRIVGVHILGPHASDIIHEAVPIINEGLTVEKIKHMIHAHPTLSEAFYEAVLGLNNEAIHLAPKNNKVAGK